MIDAPAVKVSMSAINAGYLTVNSIVTTAVNGLQRILRAEPRRYYLRFQPGSATSVNGPLMPGPPLAIVGGPFGLTIPQEWKWRDCPSIVTGEWFVDVAPGNQFVITEVWYVGGN